MKRICVLLALVLALCCAQAFAAEGDAILGRTEEDALYFSYCFPVDDTLYLVSYASLYSYRAGEADLTEYVYELTEPDEDYVYDFGVMPFASEGRLYAIVLTSRYEERTEFVGASLEALTIEGESVFFEKVCDLDWNELLEYFDDEVYATRPDAVIGVPGKVLIRYYNSSGEPRMALFDLESGRFQEIDALRDPCSVSPYRDGALLVQEYSYEDSETARLEIYDPAEDSVQPLGEIQVSSYSPLQAVAYDEATGTIYCAKGGEICPVDLAAGEIGEGVSDMPLESYSGGMGGCVLPGGYFAFCGDGAVIRNLDPGQRAQTKLKINDSSWNDSVSNAYYRFANAHGDVSVVLSRDYSESENLIESMMNRDDSIDIYVLYASSTMYDALYNRGYLMELDGSEKARTLAEGIYPSLRECLSTGGRLVALPVSVSASTLGINEKALAALGLTMADVPDNWSDFLDFLSGLEGQLGAGDGVHLFYSGYTADFARSDLFNSIFEDYQRYINVVDPAMGYDTELLRGLLDKLDRMDFEALGCPAEEDMSEDSMREYVEYPEDSVLLQTDTGCSIGNFYSEYTPVLMRVSPDQPGNIVLDATVAIVNPFTKNPEAAMAFIDELTEDLSSATLYSIDPGLDEPIRGSWSEEYLKDTQEMLDGMRAELESADAADKQMLEESIRDVEAELEYLETYAWEISPREIEWYRAHDDNVVLAKVNWLYADESGETWELLNQYREGQLGAAEMLKAIDKKLQMMLLEGY